MTDKVYFKIKTEAKNCDDHRFVFLYIGHAESRVAYNRVVKELDERSCQIFLPYVERDFGKGVSIELLDGSDDPEDLETCDIQCDTLKTDCEEISQFEYFDITGWPEYLSEDGLHSHAFDLSNSSTKSAWLRLRNTGRKGQPLITSLTVCSTIPELFYDPTDGAAEEDDDPEYLQGHIMTPYGFYHFLRGEYTPPEMKKSMLERLDLGLALEPFIAERVRRKLDADFGTGHVIVKNNDFIWSPEYGIGSSFDYTISAGPLVEKFGGIGNFEIKTVDAHVFYKKWKTADGVMPPISYRYQILFQSALLSERNAERGHPKVAFNVIGYMQNMQIDYFLTEFKESECAWVVQQTVNFWKEVDEGRAPDMTRLADYKYFTRMDRERRDGKDKMPADEVTESMQELAEAAFQASQDAKAAEERRVEMAARLLAVIPKTHKGLILNSNRLESVTVVARKENSSVMFNKATVVKE